MGLLNSFKQSLVQQWIDSITSNTDYFYAFAANPVANDDSGTAVANNDHDNIHGSNYYLLFGKKLTNTDIMPMTRRIEWASNTVYDRYDDKINNLANSDFFVMVPADPGYYRHVYKCLDNANGSPSTEVPNLIQTTAFTKSDGYIWKYIYSISDLNYTKFTTDDYIPITANATVTATASNTNGLDIVKVVNSGSGYICYHTGLVKSVVNTTLIQIENTASLDNDFYKLNGIYLYNNTSFTSQLKTVSQYVSNLSGNWVYLDTEINTSYVAPNITNYSISPKVVFDVDSVDIPYAYSVINTTSNSIHSIVLIEPGSGITRATAEIQSNTIYGSGANLHCIVPVPGGHGADPMAELGVEAIGINFSFVGSEANTITILAGYNRIGLYKNPYSRNSDGTKGSAFTDNSFDQLLKGTISPTVSFATNETVIGQDSSAVGIIAYQSGANIALVGDKHFTNGEVIISSNGAMSTTLTINTHGQIYVSDLYPIYTQNVEDVTRANNQNETYKIIIRI